MTDIAGKAVVITGGAMGIGRALAFRLQKDKPRLVLVDINKVALGKTADELRRTGAEVHTYPCDVSVRDNIYSMAGRVKKDVGPVDVLINNAGVLFGGDFLSVPDSELQKTMDINAMAYIWTMKAFMPDMVSRNMGHVVNIASLAGLAGAPGMAAYCASKHAVVGLTEAIRLEMKKKDLRGIRFTTVCPSFVNTALVTGVTAPKGAPMVSVDVIADKIAEAVKRNTLFIMEPFFVRMIPLMKALLPASLFDWLGRTQGWHNSMDTWKRQNVQ